LVLLVLVLLLLLLLLLGFEKFSNQQERRRVKAAWICLYAKEGRDVKDNGEWHSWQMIRWV